jgi:TetR/AcrR family transcriptional repressor of nem operon
MVGRPKEFDESEALARAMEVFWSQGYEATSVQDLLDAMGINRASMYATFGDKHALFVAAIDHYGRTETAKLEEALAGRPVLGTIRRILQQVGDSGGRPCRGCLATNTIVELAPHDPEVAEAACCLLRRIEKAFARALERAVDEGELPRRANTRALARFLTSTFQGLVVMRKASASRASIKDTVDVALSALGLRG